MNNIKLKLLIVLYLICEFVIAQPTIISFTPASGTVGTIVTIVGTNFNPIDSNNVVFFGASKGKVSYATSDSIRVAVPIGAIYHPISVTNLFTHLTAYSTLPFIVTYICTNSFSSSSFEGHTNFSNGDPTYCVKIADLDGDGKPDLIVPDPQTGQISILKNTSSFGNISFIVGNNWSTNYLSFAVGNAPYFVSIGDLDGDGKPDIAIANRGDTTISILRNQSAIGWISFAPKVDFRIGTTANPYPGSLDIGDIDGDGKPDIAVPNETDANVSVLKNTSTVGHISFASRINYSLPSVGESTLIEDLDGDGKPEMIVGGNMISVFKNTSTLGVISFSPRVDYYVGNQPSSIYIGDLNGDGKQEIVSADWGSDSVSVLKNECTIGTILFDTTRNFAGGIQPNNVTIGDLNGDGKPDLVTVNNYGNGISLLENTCTSAIISFAPKMDLITEQIPTFVSIGDMDADGEADIVVANFEPNTTSVLRNQNCSRIIKVLDNPLLYPNPTSTEFTILTTGEIINEIKVFNVLGYEIIDIFENGKSATIDIQFLVKGIYFVIINTEKSTYRRKVIKE